MRCSRTVGIFQISSSIGLFRHHTKKGRHFGGIKVDTPDVEFRLTVRFIVAGLLFHPNLPTLVEGLRITDDSIIRATNRQTEVKDEQFLALGDFSKKARNILVSTPKGQRHTGRGRTHSAGGDPRSGNTMASVKPGTNTRGISSTLLLTAGKTASPARSQPGSV
jgi:hypothetical protein